MKISKHLYAMAIAGACSVSVYAQNTLTFNFLETSGNVQITVTGTVTPSLWSSPTDESTPFPIELESTSPSTSPVYFIYTDGAPSASNNRAYWQPASGVTLSGPSSIGSVYYVGNGSATSSTSVGFLYFGSSGGYLYTPPSWISPTQGSLANVITISGTTFSNLGLTAGSSYSWWVTGSSVTDTVTFNIGSVTPVPEASGSVAGLGLAMAGLYQLRRRKAAGRAVES